MVLVTLNVPQRGLHPIEAARAWHLHNDDGMSFRDIRLEVVNMLKQVPSVKAVFTAVRSVDAVQGTKAMPQYGYSRCGILRPSCKVCAAAHGSVSPTPRARSLSRYPAARRFDGERSGGWRAIIAPLQGDVMVESESSQENRRRLSWPS